MRNAELIKLRRELRKAFADYMASEGCSCCRNEEEHGASEMRIAKLLKMKLYSDDSGIDYARYQAKK